MTRRKREEQELRRAAHHVAHEIRMLGEAFDAHHTSAFAYTVWFLHCRSVMDFFRACAKRDDDIIAADFFVGTDRDVPNWLPKEETPDHGFSETREAVNKLAAHLTYSRLRYEGGGDRQAVPREDVTNYMLRLARQFFTELPSDRQVWFDGLML